MSDTQDPWFAVIDDATGTLVSVGTVVADPLPAGLVKVNIGPVKPEGQRWNVASRSFDPPEAEPLILAPQDFMGRFTLAEETAIRARAMTDANMVTFLARVSRARSVSVVHPDTIAGMGYLVAIGVITDARREEILHG